MSRMGGWEEGGKELRRQALEMRLLSRLSGRVEQELAHWSVCRVLCADITNPLAPFYK